MDESISWSLSEISLCALCDLCGEKKAAVESIPHSVFDCPIIYKKKKIEP
jgi:hypothetical protein